MTEDAIKIRLISIENNQINMEKTQASINSKLDELMHKLFIDKESIVSEIVKNKGRCEIIDIRIKHLKEKMAYPAIAISIFSTLLGAIAIILKVFF